MPAQARGVRQRFVRIRLGEHQVGSLRLGRSKLPGPVGDKLADRAEIGKIARPGTRARACAARWMHLGRAASLRSKTPAKRKGSRQPAAPWRHRRVSRTKPGVPAKGTLDDTASCFGEGEIISLAPRRHPGQGQAKRSSA